MSGIISKEVLLSKFKGALVGAVLGDCIGSLFEGLWAKSIQVEKVLQNIGQLESAYDAEKGTVILPVSNICWYRIFVYFTWNKRRNITF